MLCPRFNLKMQCSLVYVCFAHVINNLVIYWGTLRDGVLSDLSSGPSRVSCYQCDLCQINFLFYESRYNILLNRSEQMKLISEIWLGMFCVFYFLR